MIIKKNMENKFFRKISSLSDIESISEIISLPEYLRKDYMKKYLLGERGYIKELSDEETIGKINYLKRNLPCMATSIFLEALPQDIYCSYLKQNHF
jgi:hypothetical protein